MSAEPLARANQQLKSIRICFACGSAVAASVHLRLLTARGDLRASRRLGLLVPQRHADAGGSEAALIGGQSHGSSHRAASQLLHQPRASSAMLSQAAARLCALTQCASLRSAGDEHCCGDRGRGQDSAMERTGKEWKKVSTRESEPPRELRPMLSLLRQSSPFVSSSSRSWQPAARC